jgi:hypothetical protein
MFIYINEFMASMIKSQFYYSLSEIFTVMVLLFHADIDRPCYPTLNNIIAGNAMMHSFQMLADEQFTFKPRNVAFLVGDFSVLTFAVMMHGQTNTRKDWIFRLTYASVGIVAFQLFFADVNSTSAFGSK